MAVVPIGQALGRWGNWANQEAFGGPTDLPWAVTIDPANRPSGYEQFETFHPTFLYESLLDLLIAAVLIFIVLRMPTNRFWREGDAIWIYMLFYGMIRFAIESLRTDSLYIGPLAGCLLGQLGIDSWWNTDVHCSQTITPGAVVADLQFSPARTGT